MPPSRDDIEAPRFSPPNWPGDRSTPEIAGIPADDACKWLGADVVSNMSTHTFLLYAAAIESCAKEVLEIGVWEGRSTRALLCAVAVTGGHLTSLDIKDFSNPTALKGLPEDILRRWTFCQVDSNVYHKQMTAKSLDVLMIDGFHSYSQVCRDFGLYAPYVRTGGFVGMHDIGSLEGPYRVFTDADPSVWEKISFSPCFGFGLLRRK